MEAPAATTPTKCTLDFEEATNATVSQLPEATKSAESSHGSSWVLLFMDSGAGLAAFEEELLLKSGNPTVDILAEC